MIRFINNIGSSSKLRSVGSKGKARSTTQSAISDGILTVDGKEIDTKTINTNTENTLHQLDKIFDKKKIEDAVIKVFTGTNTICNKDLCKDISQEIETICLSYQTTPSVEMIQDLVEEQLMKHDYYSQAKAYILYRQKRMENRELMMKLVKDLQEEAILTVMQKIQKDFSAEVYDFKGIAYEIFIILKRRYEQRYAFTYAYESMCRTYQQRSS